MKHQGISKNLPFSFSMKSKRAICGASLHTPTSKNIVFRGSRQRIASVVSAALAVMTILSAGASVHAESKPAPQETRTAVSCVGSVSKTYSAAAIMQLSDQGKLDIDQPITEYLPDFRMKDPRYKDITVRMLMNHRSGIMGTTAGNFMLLNDRDRSTHDFLLPSMRTQRLKADPDDFGAYCNDGFTLLELIVEAVSGESYTDYVQHHISKPLGLQTTGTPWDLFQNEAQVETFMGSVRFAPDYCMTIGSGGMLATAPDVCRFGSAFFMGDTRLLSDKAKREMFSTSVTDKYESNFGLGFDSVDFDDYKAAGVKVVSKGGDVNEQHASLVIAPEEKISVAVLSSGGGSTYDQLMAQALMDIALEDKGIHVEHPGVEEKETLDTVPEKYLAYAGAYISGQNICLVSFPEQKYLEFTTLDGNKRETEQYLYTTEDSFVKMDGKVETGKAVQAKNQVIAKFVKRSGKDYIVTESYSEIGLKGRLHMNDYTLQRLEENPVSDAAQAAWDARSGKKYYFCNGKYSNAYYTEMPCIRCDSYSEARGYANLGRIVDANHTEAALVMPGGRDLTDVEMRQENGTEYFVASNQETIYICEDAIPELPGDLTEVSLHTQKAVWYNIGSADNKTLTLDIPVNAAVYVYDAFDRMTYSSYMPDYGNSVPLPAGGKIVFLGEDGGTIQITQ